jgi:hypothetical protein
MAVGLRDTHIDRQIATAREFRTRSAAMPKHSAAWYVKIS